jgi:hypothetical protein
MSDGGKTAKVLFLVALAGGAAAAVFTRSPIPQPSSYHAFADTRTMFGIPNALDVLSNVAFALVGLMGFRFLARGPTMDPEASFRPGAHTALDSYRERPAYAMFFAGVFLTAFGSAFYHLAPSTPRLFWDRLPMAIAFMALFATVIAERISIYWSRNLLLPLVFLGVASVVLWRISEQRGAGDLRAYVLVQGLPMVALPLMMLLFRSRYTHGWMLLVVVVLYAGAKALEHFDAQVFAATEQRVGGHSLKHVVAALAAYVVVMMLKRRRLAPSRTARPAYMLEEEPDPGEDPGEEAG